VRVSGQGAVDPPDLYTRPSADDPGVVDLLARLGVEGEPTDLGGTMSLNLHLEALGLVLRIHPRFVTVDDLSAHRDLRRRLADDGLTVGAPQPLLGHETVDVAGRLAEVETFITAEKPAATWESYIWMYEAMGRLHASIDRVAAGLTLPEPIVATYATPEMLRHWMDLTTPAVEADDHAAGLAAQVEAMIGDLERAWIAPDQLPRRLVHGDIRLGNVVRDREGEPAYFDFGFAAHRPRVHELAYSLFWIVLRPDSSGTAAAFDWGRARELIEAYERAAGDTLSPLERRAIGPYLAAVPMYLASISSYTPDPCDRIKEEEHSLTIARWILDDPGRLGL
jgi:Ser/Thr protein kinase RdoA (MazF antagonist)